MKKLIIIMVMILTADAVYSQAFQKEKFNLDLGYAFGSHRNAFYSPGVLVSFEKGVHKWIGVGGYLGYQYNLNATGIGLGFGRFGHGGYGLFGGYGARTSNAHSIPLGVTGAFHFYQMIGDLTGKDIKQDKLDIAIKHSFGVRFDIVEGSPAVLYPRYDMGVSALIRYFFTEKVGIYAEVGYPAMGNLIIGVAFKF